MSISFVETANQLDVENQQASPALLIPGAEQTSAYGFHTDPENLTQLSLLLPSYKEAERQAHADEQAGYNFQKTIEAYSVVLDRYFERRRDWRLVVLDDGSPSPKTAELATAGGAAVIIQPKNMGRGAAYQRGVRELAPQSRVFMAHDADGSYEPGVAIRQYEAITHGADMAIAFRPESTAQHENELRAKAHIALRGIREFFAPTGLKDTQAGAFALSREAALFLFDRPGIRKRWAANHQIARIATLAGMQVAELEEHVTPKGDSTVGERLPQLGKAALRMSFDSITIGIQHNRLSRLDRQWHAQAQARPVFKIDNDESVYQTR